VDIVLAPDQWTVKITAPVRRGSQSFLFHKSGQKGADCARRPVTVAVHRSDNFVCAERPFGGPEDFQYFAFGFAGNREQLDAASERRRRTSPDLNPIELAFAKLKAFPSKLS
jgi:transposase